MAPSSTATCGTWADRLSCTADAVSPPCVETNQNKKRKTRDTLVWHSPGLVGLQATLLEQSQCHQLWTRCRLLLPQVPPTREPQANLQVATAGQIVSQACRLPAAPAGNACRLLRRRACSWIAYCGSRPSKHGTSHWAAWWATSQARRLGSQAAAATTSSYPALGTANGPGKEQARSHDAQAQLVWRALNAECPDKVRRPLTAECRDKVCRPLTAECRDKVCRPLTSEYPDKTCRRRGTPCRNPPILETRRRPGTMLDSWPY